MAYSETLDVIKTRMLGNISDSVDKTEGYLTYDNVVAVGTEVAKISTELDEVVNKFDISNLTGDELATRIQQRTGQTRKIATFATGVLTVVGNGNITIEDLFETANKVQFYSLENKTITTSGTINVQAIVAGSSGNIPANQIVVMPVTINGITSVTNLAATENGFDAESDLSLLKRYYEKLQSPSTSANSAQFKIWAKEVTGVGEAKVFPLWNGNNTVKIVIIDSNKQIANADLITNVQNYIDPGVTGLGEGVSPIGCFCTVESATSKFINVSFTAVKNTNYTDIQRQTNVENNLTNYLKSLAFVSSSVSYAQIGALILNSEGIIDYSNLQVNNLNSNIAISDTEVPMKGTVNIL